jgi:hypothetical protein
VVSKRFNQLLCHSFKFSLWIVGIGLFVGSFARVGNAIEAPECPVEVACVAPRNYSNGQLINKCSGAQINSKNRSGICRVQNGRYSKICSYLCRGTINLVPAQECPTECPLTVGSCPTFDCSTLGSVEIKIGSFPTAESCRESACPVTNRDATRNCRNKPDNLPNNSITCALE